jgi:FkbM family methyltransferase
MRSASGQENAADHGQPGARALLRRVVARAGVYDLALRARLAAERRLRLGAYAAELRFYGGFVRRGDLCFDIGANLGQKTSLFLDLGARVIAVEPQPSCLKILRRSFGRRGDVEIVPSAVGAEEGQAELFVCDETSTISSMSSRFVSTGRFATSFNWRHKIVVPTTTLDRLIDRYGIPAYCKIDVEGFEASVLAGLSRPLPLVSFEFSREFMDEARACAERLLAIGPYGFDCVLNKAADRLVSSWIEPATLLARLEAMADPLLVGEIYAQLNG